MNHPTSDLAVLDFAGARIRWTAEGPQDAPALLLLHAGGVATSDMWAPQWGELVPDHRVIRYDLRWFGRTESDDVTYSNRADAVAVLDAAEVEQATLIGASYGGGIAIDVAIEFPDRVSGLVTIGSGPSGFPETSLTAREEKLLEAIDAAEAAGDWARLVDLEADFWGAGPARKAARLDPSFLETLRALGRANIPQLDAEPRPIPLEPPAHERLSDIAVPALVMVGEHDASFAHAQARHLAASIPAAALQIFPGAAHLPSIEHPQRFLAALRSWLVAQQL